MSFHFTILSFIALLLFVAFCFTAAIPCAFLGLHWDCWLGFALFAWFLDGHVGVNRQVPPNNG
jgi:hypothetical protein